MVPSSALPSLAAVACLALAGASRPLNDELLPLAVSPHAAERSAFLSEEVEVTAGALSLLQAGGGRRGSPLPLAHWGGASTCTPLKNHGTHFTVEIEVGTPGQKFDVVADTGSDNLIVASCVCAETGHCRSEDKCYRGTNRSSSFLMPTTRNGRTPAMVLTFGSGQIEAVLATDKVKVGQVSTMMKNALLLMVDQALTIQGPFEGILGLGLPRTEAQEKAQEKAQERALSKLQPSPLSRAGQHQQMFHGRHPKGFLEHTGIRRFSMCFNDQSDGVLRLGTSEERGALGSIGQFHWGLDFRGISVGAETEPVAFCSPSAKQAGQDTPCGAIPDSGTTVIMADPQHLRLLFEQLCDRWPRCREKVATSDYRKFELFQVMLLQCQDWMENGTGLNELPPIHFHLAGHGGEQKTLKMDGSSYVFSTREDEVHYVVKHLFGVFPVQVAVPTGRQRNVCIPAFAAHQYTTQKNGPVWILGTPLFYEFQVGYDLQAKPPAITFADRPCGSCSGPATMLSLAESSRQRHNGTRAHGLPREVHGPMRTPSFDLELPL